MTSKKLPALTSDLVMTKGQAKPSTLTPKSKPTKEAGQPLNFKVTADFRREFRLVAAKKDLKLIELLNLSFEAYKRENGI